MMLTIAVLGAGMIGGALVRSLLKTGYEGEVIATRRHVERLAELEGLGATITSDNRMAAEEADIIVVCVKPKDVENVLTEIKEKADGKLIISFAAATGLNLLKRVVPEARFVRAMPNLAILVQESFTAYCADSDVTQEDKEKAENIMNRLGTAIEIEQRHMDAITALSGCAPAYLSVVVEALTYAGLEAGLPRDIALLSAAQSMVGTGRLISEAGKHPAEIRDMVTTPGGVTIEGLQELEKFPIRHAFMMAVKAAMSKSRRISELLSKS
jgi:pyrroline-5-carboxylate reductase